jgi:hypothetical protein
LFIVRNNQIKNINKIAKDDYRYEILQIHISDKKTDIDQAFQALVEDDDNDIVSYIMPLRIPNKTSNGCKVFWITYNLRYNERDILYFCPIDNQYKIFEY